MAERAQTLGEEIANSVSHGAGLAASIAALPLLVVAAARRHDPSQVVADAIFASTLVLLYGASTVYHALPRRWPRAKHVMRVVDHSAIYLLIAGTYTPFALGALHGPWGWTLLAVIWTLAVAGIALKAGLGFRYPRLSTAVYLLMGWLVVVAIHPLLLAVGVNGLAWLLAGGVCYTGGVLFYTRPRMRYAHLVWHLFVLGGSACHLVAVSLYANGIPR